MTTRMTVLGWETKNLRCPDHELVLDPRKTGAHVSLIQMPNGTGKTTTLNLLRSALSGHHWDGGEWTATEVRSLQSERKPARGFFWLHLGCNDMKCTIEIELDFALGTHQYRTTVPGSGQRDGHHPPAELAPFMQPDFVPFFVFDGETAQQLCDRSHTKADQAIQSLFQLQKMIGMSDFAETYWQRQGPAESVDQSLKQYQNKLSEARAKRDLLSNESRNLIIRQEAIKRELLDIDNAFADAIREHEEVKNRIAGLESGIERITKQIEQSAADALRVFRNPAAAISTTLESLNHFRSSLNRLKLPEDTSQEFFDELADDGTCICGRPLDDQARSQILERKKLYLSTEATAFLNKMKSDIGTQAEGANQSILLRNLSKEIENLTTQRHKNQIALELTKAKAAEESGLGDKTDRRDELIKEDVRILTRLEEITNSSITGVQVSKDPKMFRNLPAIEKLTQLLEDYISKKQGLQATKWKCKLVQRILDRSLKTAGDALQKHAVLEANEKLDRLLPNNRIRIKEIDRSLVLTNDQSQGSVGETLTVAYAFLSSIFQRADYHELPFILDSPVGSLDNDVRGEVGSLLPDLSHQVIAFVISSEKEAFWPAIQSAVPADGLRLHTLFRVPNAEYESAAEQAPERCVARSCDGILVTDRHFFDNFQRDDD